MVRNTPTATDDMNVIAFVQYLLGIGEAPAEHYFKLRHRLPRPWCEVSRIPGQVSRVGHATNRLVALWRPPSACPVGRN